MSDSLYEDLSARVAGRDIVPKAARKVTLIRPERHVPLLYWSCVGRTGGTFSAGTDWLPQFEDPSATRWFWELPSPTGALELLVRENAGSAGQRMARVQFECERPSTQTADLRVTAGRVQVKLNGATTEHTSSGQISLSFVEGLNVLEVLCNPAAGDVLLLGRFYDGITSWWVSPNRNVSRFPGAIESGERSGTFPESRHSGATIEGVF